MQYFKATRTFDITYGGDEGDLIIRGFSDSDWAGDHASKKSTSGFIFMLNGGPVSWCSKRQATVALSSTKAEYVALTLAATEATWMRLLLTEIGLLDKQGQYAEIKVLQGSKGTEQIKADAIGQEGEVSSSPLANTAAPAPNNENPLSPSSPTPQQANSNPTQMPLKGDNQGSIALAHNLVFHARTKHIDIQHHYIRDEVASGRIDLQYVPTSEMIADGMTKAITYAKFHLFVKQLHMI